MTRREEEQARIIAARERQINDLEAQILGLKNSLSWRLTSPLRSIVNAVGRFRDLFYNTSAFRWSGKPLARLIWSIPFPGSTSLLPRNPLFDSVFYLSQCPGVSKSKVLWAHYLAFGADEGRNPHPLFNTSFYQRRYTDVATSGMNLLVHYWEYGSKEGRSPHAGFDTAYYLKVSPDLGGMNPLLHYWRYGRAEGRQPVAPRKDFLIAADNDGDKTAQARAPDYWRISGVPTAEPGPIVAHGRGAPFPPIYPPN